MDVFEFQERFRKGDWIELDMAGTRLALRAIPKAAAHEENSATRRHFGGTLLGLESPCDLSELQSRLTSRGLPSEGQIINDADGGVDLLFFRDPEGNRGYFWKLAGNAPHAS